MDITFKNKSGIYIIKNLINNRIYVGSAVNLYNRKHTHLSNLRKKKHSNAKIQRFVNKYGLDKIFFECLEICEKENLIGREQFYIDNLKPFYNICKIAGSTLGYKASHELSKKLSKIRKGKKNSSGRVLSDITKQKMSEKAKTRGLHPNFKKASISSNTGRKHSFELREKIAKKQRKLSIKDIHEIIILLDKGEKQLIIAHKFKVSQRLISMVKLGTYSLKTP